MRHFIVNTGTAILVGALVTTLLLGGCGLGPPPIPTPTPPAWTTHENVAAGYALKLPASWQAWDVSTETGDAPLQAAARENESLRAFVNGQDWDELIADGVTLVAFDLGDHEPVPPFITELNVWRIPNTGGLDLDTFAQKGVASLSGSVESGITQRRVALETGEAQELLFRYDLELVDEDKMHWGTQLVAVTEYLVATPTHLYLIMMAAIPEQAEDYAPVFVEIGTSFRLLSR